MFDKGLFSRITPVLLAGGSGTRLWPLSRKSYPKQFTNLVGDLSLFQTTAQRLSTSENLKFRAPITITNSDFRFIAAQQLQQISIDPGPILIEPIGRNTAPAILAASFYAISQDPDAILLVAPCDHKIMNKNEFYEAIKIGLQRIKLEKIVVFGVDPTRIETGYGYLEINTSSETNHKNLERFVEKPDYQIAKKMIEEGCCLWNSGIYLFKASDMIAAFKAHSPDLIEPVTASVKHGRPDLGFFRLEPKHWSGCKDISIDYAIMENAKNLSVVKFSGGWSDLGDWASIWRECPADDTGVVATANTTSIDCINSLLRSENRSQHLVGLGLENIIAVAMPDAVLVADLSKAQDVKKIISQLKIDDVDQADLSPIDHRPWGWFESLTKSEHFQVKKIYVNSGASLSLQSHKHRSEHWVVVEGTATVVIDSETMHIHEGQSVYVPQGIVHRIQNNAIVPLLIIEIQTGTYLGEDDIIRYEDEYARNTHIAQD